MEIIKVVRLKNRESKAIVMMSGGGETLFASARQQKAVRGAG